MLFVYLFFAPKNISCEYSLELPYFIIFYYYYYYIFFVFEQNISCGYALELSHWDNSNEYQQDMFWCKNKKKKDIWTFPLSEPMELWPCHTKWGSEMFFLPSLTLYHFSARKESLPQLACCTENRCRYLLLLSGIHPPHSENLVAGQRHHLTCSCVDYEAEIDKKTIELFLGA